MRRPVGTDEGATPVPSPAAAGRAVAAIAAPPSDLVPGRELAPHRVRARNLFRTAPNRIHDDATARALGYAAGLVGGTTVYAHLAGPLVAHLGPAWIERGTAEVRFRRPVYEGDVLEVRARVAARGGSEGAGEIALDVEVRTARGGAVVTARAGLAWGGPPVAPDPAGYPAAPLPAAPPPATADLLGRLDPLGSPGLLLDAEALARYADEVDDPSPLYRGPAAVAHPGLLLQQANRALSENVGLGPWIHVASDLAHAGSARAGEHLTTRGRVRRVFERQGHQLVDLDVLVVAAGERPVLHVRHEAIWRLRGAG